MKRIGKILIGVPLYVLLLLAVFLADMQLGGIAIRGMKSKNGFANKVVL